jgi:hypothetical protein
LEVHACEGRWEKVANAKVLVCALKACLPRCSSAAELNLGWNATEGWMAKFVDLFARSHCLQVTPILLNETRFEGLTPAS